MDSVAEATGLIVPIGERVIRAACEQIARWRNTGLGDVPAAVNVSAHQLKSPNLVSTIVQALADFDVPPCLLELELTETAMMEDVEATRRNIASLKEIGVSISIDDFGAGYSSLALLKRFCVDTLKVDRSFTKDVPHDDEATAILRAIITMAESLRISVVAEGVETKDQLEFLRDLDCEQAQGFYFSKPVVASAASELIASYGLLPRATKEKLSAPKLAVVTSLSSVAAKSSHASNK